MLTRNKKIGSARLSPLRWLVDIHSYFNKLTILNNTILRILQNKDLYFPVAQLYRNFNILPPSKLHQQQIFILLQKSLYNSNQLPLVFGDYFTPGVEVIFI